MLESYIKKNQPREPWPIWLVFTLAAVLGIAAALGVAITSHPEWFGDVLLP